MKKILHVTDCLNAGVLRAIEIVVRNNSQNHHLILWDSHDDTPEPDISKLLELQVTLLRWDGNFFNKSLILRKNIAKIEPDILFLHSSIAGFIGRLSTQFKNIYFSPHCFAFQRQDISLISRIFFLAIEKLLSIRTKFYICNWPIEADLVIKHFKNSNMIFYPLINYEIQDQFIKNSGNRVISIGRLRPQKDPIFFSEVVKYIKGNSELDFYWIGSGDSRFIDILKTCNVEVLGWLDHTKDELLNKNVKIQLITSAWESGPFTFYEALEEGIPSLLRNIQAFDNLDCDKYSNSKEMADALLNTVSNEELRYEIYNQQIRAVKKLFNQYLEFSRREIF